MADIVRLAPLHIRKDAVQVQLIVRVDAPSHALLVLRLVPRAAEVLVARAAVHHAEARLADAQVLALAAQVLAAAVVADSEARADVEATRIPARTSTSIAL